MTEYLFAYGTLRHPDVQLATFGRVLDGDDDAVVGYVLSNAIGDQSVTTNWSSRGPAVLEPSAVGGASVLGMVFAVDIQDLVAADVYQVEEYRRIEVVLQSGRRAWAYVRHST